MPARLKTLLIVGVCLSAISACDSKQAPIEVAAEAAKPTEPAVATAEPEVVAPIEDFLLETAVKQSDTFESLQKQYGDTNIIKSELPGAEGETSQGWMLFPKDAEKKLLIYLDANDLHPDSAIANGISSKWQLSNSIKLGTDIKALQALNLKTFSFYGFYWDYGGVISDWNGGALDKKAANGSHVGMNLCPPENAKLPDNYLSGDRTFKSDDPLALKFPPVVCEIRLSFPRPE